MADLAFVVLWRSIVALSVIWSETMCLGLTNEEQSLKEWLDYIEVGSTWLEKFIYLFDVQMAECKLPVLVKAHLEVLGRALTVFVLKDLGQRKV